MTTPSWLAACLLGWTTTVSAKDAKLYVNGERADGLRDVVLESVDVRIDDKGNLWITAPQYRVGGTEGEAATEAAPAGAWWLVVEDGGACSRWCASRRSISSLLVPITLRPAARRASRSSTTVVALSSSPVASVASGSSPPRRSSRLAPDASC